MALVTWFPRYVIADFLRANQDQIDKYNELLAAFIWSKWQSQITGVEDLPIGIPVLNKMSLRPKDEMVTLEQIKFIMDRMKQDYSTLDVVVSNIPFEDLERTPRPFGWNFQIKRFQRHKERGDLTDDFTDYINTKISYKYPTKSQVRLLVILETGAKIDLRKTRSNVKWEKFPFTELHFMYFRDKLYFGEVWPDEYVYSIKREDVLK